MDKDLENKFLPRFRKSVINTSNNYLIALKLSHI